MKIGIFFLLTVLISSNGVYSFDILGIFPFQGKSHFFVFETYLKELVGRGHNLTVISYFPQKQPIQNYTDIVLGDGKQIYEDVISMDKTVWSTMKLAKKFMDVTLENCRGLLDNQSVQRLVKTQQKFDLVIVEAWLSDCALGVAYKIGAPVIAINSHLVPPYVYDHFGVPNQELLINPNPSFVERLFWAGALKIFPFIFRWYKYTEEEILAEYFDDVPPLKELGKEIKLLLAYIHHSVFGAQAWPETIKEVGGYHVAKPKPLPQNIREFIEKSEHGVIYVSFGSMVKAASLSPHKLEAIVGALSDLPQRVIWKWEADNLPGNPKNIYVSKWLPQNDILAHPNVVAFYSHGGCLGLTESVHHGVPMVVTPVFADQLLNVIFIERKGVGVRMEFGELTKEALLERLKIVLKPEVAFFLLLNEELRQRKLQRRRLRDTNNPFELPDREFQFLYRINKEMGLYLIQQLEGTLGAPDAPHGIPVHIQVLSSVMFLAAGSYQRGVGQDHNLCIAQTTMSKYLDKVVQAINQQFRERAKEISRQWHDRPLSPMDTAIYWTEYVVRHPNSTLRTPAVGKPQYQLLGLDVLFTVLSVLLVCTYAFVSVLKCLCLGRRKSKSKKD